ncbi:MAG: mobile mystery protein B, partial [Limisphaerales bacterium]
MGRTTLIKFSVTPGQTPLNPDELDDLIPDYISLQSELDELEQANILEAESNLFGRDHSEILNEEFLKNIHKRMFDKVWKWAGQFRRSDKNIGCEWTEIPILLKILLDDARYWIANKTFDPDETVMRFHFRLVHKIHGFPNGNGRHARLMADLLITKVGRSRFSWGSQSLKRPG